MQLDIFIGYLYGRINSFLCTTSIIFNMLAPVRDKNICLLLVQVWVTSSSTSLSLQIFFPTDDIFDGSKVLKISGNKIWALCWLDNNSPSLPQKFQ
jgi:hypothetical protein